MASHKLTRTPRLIITVVAMLFLGCMATNPQTALAHAASPSSHRTLVVKGTPYTLTQGEALKVPTTWPDGSQGFIVAKFDVTSSTNTPGCATSSSTLQGLNAFGGVLFSYTLLEYMCWDDINITYHGNPYAQWSSNFGWSMNRHSEVIDYFNTQAGKATGKFRFNGPFGIGCGSGYIDEFFDNHGPSGGDSGPASEFGC